jgi:hypothetical protein
MVIEYLTRQIPGIDKNIIYEVINKIDHRVGILTV